MPNPTDEDIMRLLNHLNGTCAAPHCFSPEEIQMLAAGDKKAWNSVLSEVSAGSRRNFVKDFVLEKFPDRRSISPTLVG